jgi:hypothetical protein
VSIAIIAVESFLKGLRLRIYITASVTPFLPDYLGQFLAFLIYQHRPQIRVNIKYHVRLWLIWLIYYPHNQLTAESLPAFIFVVFHHEA